MFRILPANARVSIICFISWSTFEMCDFGHQSQSFFWSRSTSSLMFTTRVLCVQFKWVWTLVEWKYMNQTVQYQQPRCSFIVRNFRLFYFWIFVSGFKECTSSFAYWPLWQWSMWKQNKHNPIWISAPLTQFDFKPNSSFYLFFSLKSF